MTVGNINTERADSQWQKVNRGIPLWQKVQCWYSIGTAWKGRKILREWCPCLTNQIYLYVCIDTKLVFMNQFAVSMNAYLHTKNWSHTYFHSWGIGEHTQLIFINLFALSVDLYPHAKIQSHTCSHSWDVDDLLFQGTLGMLNHVRPHPPDNFESNYFFYELIPTHRKSNLYLLTFWRYCWFIILKSLGIPSYVRLNPPDINNSICYT